MAGDAHGAHLRGDEAAPAHQPAHAKVPDNSYLSAAREAERNNRAVSAICIVLVAVLAVVMGARPVPSDPASSGTALSSGIAQAEIRQLGEVIDEASALAELIIWESDPENIHVEPGAAVEAVTSAQGVTTTAPEGFSQTSAAAALDQAIADFEAKGYVLGLALVDVETGRGISYNADEPRYPASSIKAAFCTYVLEGNELVSEGLVRTCIVDSSNDAYHALIRAYGQQGFSEWLAPMAPDAAGNASVHYYPWISPNEFLAVWQETYRFCSSDEPGAAELADFLGRTTTTAWGELFRGEWEVWAKAGWYPSTIERATCDCGVVFSDCGPYIVVVMSDAPEDFEALKPVLDAINVAHGKMCGGSTESHLA